MKIKTYRRLEQLEQMSAQRAAAQRTTNTGPLVSETIRNLLRARGIEQQSQESLAETLARALGITAIELRNRLSAGRLFA